MHVYVHVRYNTCMHAWTIDITGFMVFGTVMSHRNDDVVIAGTRITEQGIKAVVDALKDNHGIEVLDVEGLY